MQNNDSIIYKSLLTGLDRHARKRGEPTKEMVNRWLSERLWKTV